MTKRKTKTKGYVMCPRQRMIDEIELHTGMVVEKNGDKIPTHGDVWACHVMLKPYLSCLRAVMLPKAERERLLPKYLTVARNAVLEMNKATRDGKPRFKQYDPKEVPFPY